jgi:hypothetical protein
MRLPSLAMNIAVRRWQVASCASDGAILRARHWVLRNSQYAFSYNGVYSGIYRSLCKEVGVMMIDYFRIPASSFRHDSSTLVCT